MTLVINVTLIPFLENTLHLNAKQTYQEIRNGVD